MGPILRKDFCFTGGIMSKKEKYLGKIQLAAMGYDDPKDVRVFSIFILIVAGIFYLFLLGIK